MRYDETVPMTTEQYDVISRAFSMEFTRLQLQQGKVSLIQDMIGQRLRFVASWKVAAQKAHDTVRAPADWWEAFKERWFPAWALRRWPVRYEEWRAYRILPAVKLPDLTASYFEFIREYGGGA